MFTSQQKSKAKLQKTDLVKQMMNNVLLFKNKRN